MAGLRGGGGNISVEFMPGPAALKLYCAHLSNNVNNCDKKIHGFVACRHKELFKVKWNRMGKQ